MRDRLDSSLKLWLSRGKQTDDQDTVENAAFSANGARVLTASTADTVTLWDASSGKLIASFDNLGWPFHAALSPDGTRVVTANAVNYMAELWDAVSANIWPPLSIAPE